MDIQALPNDNWHCFLGDDAGEESVRLSDLLPRTNHTSLRAEPPRDVARNGEA
jgi:hypothetical protein